MLKGLIKSPYIIIFWEFHHPHSIITYFQKGIMDSTTNHQPLKIPIEGNSTTWWPSDHISQQEGFFNKVVTISTTQEVPQYLHHSFKGARTIKPPFVGVPRLSHALGPSPRVPRPHQPTHDHIISFKSTRTIKPPSVGPRSSSLCKRLHGLLQPP